MSDLFTEFVNRLVESVTEARGTLPPAARRALLAQARAATLRESAEPAATEAAALPIELTSYADTVARHAYKVTDAQVEELQRDGVSEDAIFEATASAAVGAGLARLDRAMALLRGER
jgi:hypothetical protein